MGLLQREVAARIGVSSYAYLSWETDEAKPFPKTYARIVRFLGYDPSGPALTLGEQIRAKRRERGITARQLAVQLGWDEGTVRRYEKDLWVPQGPRRKRLDSFLTSGTSPKKVDQEE
jgi:transcriptional regulator with XRE-family HTH domain